MKAQPTEIGLCEGEFHRTGNPLFALRAWQIARANDIEPPDWVMAYLDQSVENIFSVEEPPKSNVGDLIAKAFGFTIGRGKTSAFSGFVLQIQATGYYAKVRLRIEHIHGDGRREKLSNAIRAVAEEDGVSPSTVGRNYNEIHDHISSL
jgi:hypothetical protein